MIGNYISDIFPGITTTGSSKAYRIFTCMENSFLLIFYCDIIVLRSSSSSSFGLLLEFGWFIGNSSSTL